MEDQHQEMNNPPPIIRQCAKPHHCAIPVADSTCSQANFKQALEPFLGQPLVIRDRADQHPTEFFAQKHIFRTCHAHARPPCCILGIYSNTHKHVGRVTKCVKSLEKLGCVPRPHPVIPGQPSSAGLMGPIVKCADAMKFMKSNSIGEGKDDTGNGL